MKWPTVKLPRWTPDQKEAAVFILGLGCIIYGVDMMHRPSALILAGLILVVISVVCFQPER